MQKISGGDINATSMLKGIAILGVVTLHIFTSTPGFFTGRTTPLGPIAFDQLLRFCVPLFIALSGYALARRYKKGFSLITYFRRRIMTIVPLYLLWSLLFIYIFPRLYPAWASAPGIPLLDILLLGKADYHLYFVPLIVQLYIFFPFLIQWMRRRPIATLFGMGLIQVGAFLLLSRWSLGNLVDAQFIWDQSHYGISFFWIFYFGLGMWIAETQGQRKWRRSWVVYLSLLIVGIIASILGAKSSIQGGLDTILALRFTRFPVALYASGVIGLTLHFREPILRQAASLRHVLVRLGENSYLIYLSHTIVLRMLFSYLEHTQSLISLIPALLIYLVAVAVSLVIQ